MTSAAYLAEVLDNLDEHLDRYNVPLSEDETNRVAWLGVVLQPLDRDLARANHVADQTRDGRIGGLITYVYADSPAAEAGIEPGAILLRLHVEDQVRPLEVRVVESPLSSVAFPWDRLDEIPEQVFDRLPKPWPSVENNFTRMLTDLGFGTRFTAELIVDGELRREDFVVSPSPPHFEAAPQHQTDEFGVTVRDVTYEVRRQLQIGSEETGVIVSKIEAGSKASVAGIRPYEIITHINGRAVPDVKLFEAYMADSDQLELSVKRMTRSRQVRLK
jgi:S1-C subfamily serine protease